MARGRMEGMKQLWDGGSGVSGFLAASLQLMSM